MTAPAGPPSGDPTPGSKPADGSRSRPMPDGLDVLTAELRYHRQRRDLYRAKMYGPRPTSESRLRELQRALESAEVRLAAARAAGSAG